MEIKKIHEMSPLTLDALHKFSSNSFRNEGKIE